MRYEYVEIRSGMNTGIVIRSTDLASIYEPITTGIQKMIPKSSFDKRSKLLGSAYECVIKQLDNKDDVVTWWIYKQLCETGWEPFAALEFFTNTWLYRVHFRKAIEE